MSTNVLYALVGLLFLAMRLSADFKKDKGLNTKAKAFQSICLGLIVLSYASSLRYVGWIFRHYDKAVERFSTEVGFISGKLHFILFLIHVILSVAVLYAAFLLARRNQKALSFIFYSLPLLALTEMFNFYRGWLSDGEELELNHGYIFLISFILFGGITLSILVLYNSTFMKEFLDFKTPDLRLDAEENRKTPNE